MNIEQVCSYADALSAAKRGPAAAQEFHGFMLSDRVVRNANIENQIEIEYAGLLLLGGDSRPGAEPGGPAARNAGQLDLT